MFLFAVIGGWWTSRREEGIRSRATGSGGQATYLDTLDNQAPPCLSGVFGHFLCCVFSQTTMPLLLYALFNVEVPVDAQCSVLFN